MPLTRPLRASNAPLKYPYVYPEIQENGFLFQKKSLPLAYVLKK